MRTTALAGEQSGGRSLARSGFLSLDHTSGHTQFLQLAAWRSHALTDRADSKGYLNPAFNSNPYSILLPHEYRWLSFSHIRYPRFRISAVLFQYHEEHQYSTRGQILKPVACVEPSPGLPGNEMQMISLASKNSGASLTSRWLLLYVSRFTRFRYKRRFAGTQPPRITKVTCNYDRQ
jgi:hypothetical protein